MRRGLVAQLAFDDYAVDDGENRVVGCPSEMGANGGAVVGRNGYLHESSRRSAVGQLESKRMTPCDQWHGLTYGQVIYSYITHRSTRLGTVPSLATWLTASGTRPI